MASGGSSSILDLYVESSAKADPTLFGQLAHCQICETEHLHAEPCELALLEPSTPLAELENKIGGQIKIVAKFKSFLQNLGDFERILSIPREKVLLGASPKTTLSETLEAAVAPSEAHCCEKCRMDTARLMTQIHEIPPVLVLQFSRFQVIEGRLTKNLTWVDFPETL